MTLLGTLLQIGVSILLTAAPAAILKREQMRVTIALSFLAILLANLVGGLVIGVPVVIVLCLFCLWVRFVGHADGGFKGILFIATVVLSGLFLIQHILHLPVRLYLNQHASRIAGNVAGIFAAAAMLSASLEMFVLRKRG